MLIGQTLIRYRSPVKEQTSKNKNVEQIMEQGLQSQQSRILIVDDEPFNLMGLKKVIKGLNSFKGIDRLIDTANSA